MTRDNSLDLLHDARRATATAAAILVLTLGVAASASAFGGPGGHGGHWGHGGPGRAGGPGDAFMGQALATLKPQLNLDPAQQQRFDQLVAQGKSAREAGRANHERARAALRAQLAKAEPDLAAAASVADEVQAANLAARRKVRDDWLQLYATFTPAQKAVVREFLSQRVNRAEGYRQRMKGRPAEPRS